MKTAKAVAKSICYWAPFALASAVVVLAIAYMIAVNGARPVSVSGFVDTAVVGSYTLTYTASDSLGNTVSVDRIVNVVPK